MILGRWLRGRRQGIEARAEVRAEARLEVELNELLLAVAPPDHAAGLRSVAICSAEVGDGVSTVCIHVAEALTSHLDARVLLVDANFRHAGLHTTFGVDREPGLKEVLRGELPLPRAVRPTGHAGLELLTNGGGKAETGDRLLSAAMADLMELARGRYGMIVLDAGALLVSQEAAMVCHAAHGVLLTLQAGMTQGEQLARAQRLLKRSDANLLGVVINDPRGEFVRDES